MRQSEAILLWVFTLVLAATDNICNQHRLVDGCSIHDQCGVEPVDVQSVHRTATQSSTQSLASVDISLPIAYHAHVSGDLGIVEKN